MKNVDNEVQVLRSEIDSLALVFNEMKITFDGKRGLASQTGDEEHYWKTVKRTLDDSQNNW